MPKKIIAIPINKYQGQDFPTQHFKSIQDCAEKMGFSVTKIYEALREGKPARGYYIDEEIEQ
ncbi:MAG: hypothetical protein IJJ71_12135 [Treponema sp.]|uniref:hypothetical protein n=1 Tax=Treponema sp. TaxID=166 RepID=UPI0025ED008C|nr:hypothetical protein [Treponema sp.]MBQ3845773.1 hypothetical protein [Bacteroidales bacterium]MBR0496912.1 hypothetical protein [Treponema sp.]